MNNLSSAPNLLPADGAAYLFHDYFEVDQFALLKDTIEWKEESIVIFGERKLVPRLTAYYGTHSYKYSGTDHAARPLTDELTSIQAACEEMAEYPFNSVLCNYYRNGGDSMGYHRDNESVMETQCIASVSFGASRRMNFRHRSSRERITLDLHAGSLLLMVDCQHHWEHGIPKTKMPIGGRINLTYRWINPQNDTLDVDGLL